MQGIWTLQVYYTVTFNTSYHTMHALPVHVLEVLPIALLGIKPGFALFEVT
jgi:hypothetical protein